MPEDIFGCHNCVCVCGGGGATGIYLVEARDAAKHATMHRTAPTTINVHSMKLRNPGFRGEHASLLPPICRPPIFWNPFKFPLRLLSKGL